MGKEDMDNEVPKIDAMKELDESIKEAIVLETLRVINSNIGIYKSKIPEVYTLLEEKYGIGKNGINKIRKNVSKE